ncbi:MAG TPA: FHA domain-containing protein [Nocardioides sp.]|nr:FHA domain-containing protein [Nocardioides sp.]
MPALVVEVEGRVLRLDGKPVYRIGRAIEADVVLSAGSVSRHHAELRARPDGGWVLVDAGSQFGTYVDGERITEYPVERRISVRCGPPAPGAELAVLPAEQHATSSVPPVPLPPLPGEEKTQVLAAARGPQGAVQRTGPDLLVVTEGHEHRFRHPTAITVGRRNDCTVVIGDPACSRVHGRVDPVPGGWTYTNLSNEGTWLDGRRMPTRRFEERLSVRLGHPVAGPELTLVPILSAQEEERRIARRRWGRRLAIAGAAAAVLVLVAGITGGAVWMVREDGEGGGGGASSPSADTRGVLTASELDTAKAATVKITARSHLLSDPADTGTYHGSGSIIRADGLILTNAHVAAPESPGLSERYGHEQAIADPDYLLISLTDGLTDTNAPPSYRARVVEADGRLDIAVVRIYADADGKPLTSPPDLPTVPLGSSADLRAGDDVTVLGFPAVAGAGESITVTTGVVSTVLNDPELGPRSELDTDARIAPGNSGGVAVNNDGELIGVPTALESDRESTVTSGRIRSIDPAKDLIDRAEGAGG